MKKIILLLICLGFTGCSSFEANGKQEGNISMNRSIASTQALSKRCSNSLIKNAISAAMKSMSADGKALESYSFNGFITGQNIAPGKAKTVVFAKEKAKQPKEKLRMYFVQNFYFEDASCEIVEIYQSSALGIDPL